MQMLAINLLFVQQDIFSQRLSPAMSSTQFTTNVTAQSSSEYLSRNFLEDGGENNKTFLDKNRLNMWYLLLFPLIVSAVTGNFLVVAAVSMEKKLRTGATNKFIASLAISDLLVGLLVMPLALYIKINNDQWDLSEGWCRFHLCSSVFSTTASILHLVAISLDRYFAIIFPTEYQQHFARTRAPPYLIIIWVISLLMSLTTFLEKAKNEHKICWIEDPQYLILSALISFLIPAFIVIFLYLKIFRKLRRHLSIFWALKNRLVRKRTPPAVIVEEVRSRRGSRLNSMGGDSKASTGSRARSASQPEIAGIEEVEFRARFRSPTISGDTLRQLDPSETMPEALEPPEPPSRRVSIASTVVAFHRRTKDSISHVTKKLTTEKNVDQSVPSALSLVTPPENLSLSLGAMQLAVLENHVIQPAHAPLSKLLAVPQVEIAGLRLPGPDGTVAPCSNRLNFNTKMSVDSSVFSLTVPDRPDCPKAP